MSHDQTSLVLAPAAPAFCKSDGAGDRGDRGLLGLRPGCGTWCGNVGGGVNLCQNTQLRLHRKSPTPRPIHWFNHLASGRGLCCSMADGEAVADPDWESKEGHYRVRLDNKWVDVPDDAVITEPNRAGRTMVWPLWIGADVSVRCFMPGSMT